MEYFKSRNLCYELPFIVNNDRTLSEKEYTKKTVNTFILDIFTL